MHACNLLLEVNAVAAVVDHDHGVLRVDKLSQLLDVRAFPLVPHGGAHNRLGGIESIEHDRMAAGFFDQSRAVVLEGVSDIAQCLVDLLRSFTQELEHGS